MALAVSAALAACAPTGTPLERGAQAHRAGDLRLARVELLNAITSGPRDARARLLLAEVLLALGDGAAAEVQIGEARRLGAGIPETRPLLGHARLLQDDPRGALAEVTDFVPEHQAYAARIRGRALARLGDRAAAQNEFDAAIRGAPNDALTLVDAARFRRDSGDVAGALVLADRAVAAGRSSAEPLLLRGELSRSQYGLAAALPWFDRALEVDPGHVDARLERAVTYAELGRMTAMLADTREVHLHSGGHPTAYWLQAVLAARARNFTLARSLYDRTGGRFDSTPAGLLLRGVIDLETGNSEQAATRLARLLDRQPGNRKARRLLAAAQWRMGDAAAVVATLRPLVVRPDADAYSLSLIGRAMARLGDREGASIYLARAARPNPEALSSLDPLDDAAFASLQRIAAAEPGNGPVQLRLVSALLARGLGAEALARARRLQAANPGAPQPHVLVGDALGIKGDFAGAARAYATAANLAFNEPVALRLIEALQRSGNQTAADQVLALFARQNPRNVPVQVLLGGKAMRDENWPEAILIYEGLRRRLGNNDATVLNNLAWAYSEEGRYAEALPLARRAWSLDRFNPATADTYGWILFKSGRDPAAGLALIERAARGAPRDVDIRRRLEQARRS